MSFRGEDFSFAVVLNVLSLFFCVRVLLPALSFVWTHFTAHLIAQQSDRLCKNSIQCVGLEERPCVFVKIALQLGVRLCRIRQLKMLLKNTQMKYSWLGIDEKNRANKKNPLT